MITKIGHRGAKGYVVENTLASFQKAINLGVNGIELDVHCCASGELVVFHDFTLDRLTNGTGAISNFSLSELKKIKIDNDYEIPTLVEVLQLVNKKCFLNVELKGKQTAEPVFQLLLKYMNEQNWQPTDFIVSSFQFDELKQFASFQSEIPLAILTQASVNQAIEWAQQFNAKAIHPHFSLLTKENCTKAKDFGLQINTWTVNEYAAIEYIKRFEIDGIISDFPDRI
ncbi:glycerophosphodiester phosphodiesterase [Flavobacterium sp.]|uniref:glycerophosphodiester phosphodiesterase n=1 Tax=Flavobacterium sp. TaxID=239 RepID=UPI0035289440